MARTQLNGGRAIKDGTISNLQISATAAIATSKLADGANFLLKDGSVAMTGAFAGGGQQIKNIADATLAQDAVTKSQLDAHIASAAGGLIFKGAFDASAGTFPAGSLKGDYYKVTVAGTIDGVIFTVGDTLFAEIDNAATGTYAANWFKVDNTESVTSVAGKTGVVTLVVADITDLTATATELNYMNGVTSAVQTQLNAKLDDTQLDTNANLGTDNTLVPSQGAVKSYVDTAVAGAIINFADMEIPTGAINTINTTYNIANTPIAGSTHVYYDGELMQSGAGNDYTITGNTITFLDAPETGDKILVSYRY